MLAEVLDSWKNAKDKQRPALALKVLAEAEASVSKWDRTKEKRRPGLDLSGAKPGTGSPARESWMEFLDVTGRSAFLRDLDSAQRNRWAEIVFSILQMTRYSLDDLLAQRVNEHPRQVLFRDMSVSPTVDWTYEQIYRHLRDILALRY
ncbi:MAG: hypothetical protein NTW31_05525 [Bacteroidetes bacterium]|nr:hypothetical protein [Bacteroidota bacterium]